MKIVKSKLKVTYIILVLLFVTYAYFNYYSSWNLLSIDAKYRYFGWEKQNIYGFYSNERLESGLEFNWTHYKALKRVKIRGTKIVIPIFCLKPDIEKKPVNTKIFFNNKFVDELEIADHNIRYLTYDVTKMRYKTGGVLEIKFEVDSLWAPSEYGMSEDSRLLGVAVGRIEFVK